MQKKVALITGASRGIGKAIALCFAKQGYHIIITASKDHEGLAAVKNEALKFHIQCLDFLTDMSDHAQVKSMFLQVEKEFGTIDVLVNNAGISHIGLFTDMSPIQWNHMIDVNLKSAINCSYYAIPLMRKLGHGKIINISSVWGEHGASCEVIYSATKGALNSFTKALAKELAPSNIQINAIACGAIETSMNDCLSQEEKEEIAQQIPAGRFGTCEEVAQLTLLIAQSPTYLNGQIVTMDGAWC